MAHKALRDVEVEGRIDIGKSMHVAEFPPPNTGQAYRNDLFYYEGHSDPDYDGLYMAIYDGNYATGEPYDAPFLKVDGPIVPVVHESWDPSGSYDFMDMIIFDTMNDPIGGYGARLHLVVTAKNGVSNLGANPLSNANKGNFQVMNRLTGPMDHLRLPGTGGLTQNIHSKKSQKILIDQPNMTLDLPSPPTIGSPEYHSFWGQGGTSICIGSQLNTTNLTVTCSAPNSFTDGSTSKFLNSPYGFWYFTPIPNSWPYNYDGVKWMVTGSGITMG